MKVAVVYATDFSAISPGGIQSYVYQLGQLAPRHLEISYFGVNGSLASLPRPDDHNVSVVGRVPDRGPLNASFLRGLAKIRDQLKCYDCIVSHRAEYLAVLPLGVPKVTVLHGATLNAWKSGRRLFGIAQVGAEAWACLQSDLVLSVDKAGLFPGFSNLTARLEQVRVPAQQEFMDCIPGVWPREKRVVTASRLVPEKRVQILIELAHVSGYSLDVFGDGVCRSELEKYAAALDAEVTFHGFQSASTIAKSYTTASCFALASVFEGYPLAAVEAGTAGLPVFGVQTNGVRALRPYGATDVGSVGEAMMLLTGDDLEQYVPDRFRIWEDHSPQRVASQFWADVESVA